MQKIQSLFGLSSLVYESFVDCGGNTAQLEQLLPGIMQQTDLAMKENCLKDLLAELVTMQGTASHPSIKALHISRFFKYVN